MEAPILTYSKIIKPYGCKDLKVRQQENFRALMNNYDEVGRLTKVAADSTGSATKRMETYLDSVEAKTNNLKSAWESFVMSLNQSDSYKGFLDVLINLLDKIQYADWKAVGDVLTVFGTVLSLLGAAKGLSVLKSAFKEIKGLSSLLGVFSPKILILVAAFTALVVAIKSINTNLDKQVADIDKRAESINKEKEAIEEDKKSVQELYAEYQNLQSKQSLVGLDSDERKKMADITKELVEQYGFEYQSVDSLTGGYVLATDALTKYTEAKKKQIQQLNEEERKNNIKKTATYGKKQKKAQSGLDWLDGKKSGNMWESTNVMDTTGLLFKGLWKGITGTGSFEDDFWAVYDDYFKNKSKELKETVQESSNNIVSSIMDTLAPTIENSGLSDRFTTLFTNQLTAGLKQVNISKLDSDKEVEKIISSYEKLLSSPDIKKYSDELDKKLTEFETKVSNKNSNMTLKDYKDYNEAIEKQASLSMTLLSNIIGIDKAQKIVTESLEKQLSNTGSYFALLSDQIKNDYGENSQVVKNFDNIASSIININKQLADGQIDVKNYFNLMKAQIDSIDTSKIEDSFGNIGNYLATMGQIANSSGGQLQSVITSMQQGKKLNNEGVDDIKSYVGVLGMVRSSMKKKMTNEDGSYKILKDTQGNDYDSKQLFEDTSGTNQSTVTSLQKQQSSLQEKINNLNSQISALNKAKNGETIPSDMNVKTSTSDNKSVYNRNIQQSSISDSNIKLASKPVQQTPKITGNDPVKGLQVSDDDILDRIAEINKGQDKTADKAKAIKEINELIAQKQKELNKLKEKDTGITEDIEKEQKKVNKGMDSYLDDMEKGTNYLDSFDWDSLDKSSDTLFQGFADGALKANSTIDNVNKKYKDAAMNMASHFQEMTGQVGSALEGLNENVRSSLTQIGEETLKQIGLTSGASTEEIANAMLSSQSNFNAVVGAMNKNAQTALQSVLEGAGGMLEQLGAAIESFTGEIDISIGGLHLNGLSSYNPITGMDLFSEGKEVKSKISFGGSGIDTKSLGGAIKDAGTALKSNAGALASQWNPIQPNLIDTNKKNTNGNTSNYSPNGGSGSKNKKSGSDYSADDAASDLKDILNDIEKYEEDIELDLEDQTEQFINQEMLASNRLDTLKEELDYYNDIYDVTENTSKWLETQNKLLDNQSKKVGSLQNATASIEAQRKKLIDQNSQYNVSSWFDSEGNDTLAYGDLINSFEYQKEAIERETARKMRDVYNSVAGSTSKDAISSAKDKIKQIEDEGDIRIKALEKEQKKVENIHDSVSQLNDAWKDNQDAIRDALKELHDLVKSIRDELLDDITEQLEKAVDRANKSLDKSVTRMEQLVTIQEKYNDILNECIDTQDELDDELQSSLDSFEYLDEQMRELMFNEKDYKVLSDTLEGIQKDIANIWEDHYNQIDELTDDTMYKAEYITSETERQLDMKMKEYELAKAELDVAKARTNLQNVQNERNVRMFVGGQWIWTADPNAVKDAQQQLADAERAKNKVEREAEQKKLLDRMNQMIDADNLQIDENNELLERIQDAIEDQTTEIKSIENALANASGEDLPALNDVLSGAFGKDGGDFKTIMANLNKGQTELAAALDGKTTAQAESQLKSNNMSKSDFESLVKRLGYGWDEKTGTVTTWDGSFKAHYQGWRDTSSTNTPLGTSSNGASVTGGNSGSSSSAASSGGGGNNTGGFPKAGRVSTSSLPLRIRSGAGTNYRVLGTMPRGASVTITGEAGNGWAKISYNGINGYASKQYLTYDQGGLAQGKGIFLKDVNVPERVLSPKQTKSFDILVKNLTTNPVLAALTKDVKGTSNLNGLMGGSGETKQYYFSNFTVKSDNLTEFIDSLEGMIPIANK